MNKPTFSHVLAPIKIGNLTVKNRVVVTAHTYGLLDGSLEGFDAMAEYVGARLDGGVGLLVMGETVAEPAAQSAAGEWGAAVSGDDLVPLYARIAAQANANGAVVLEQLYNPGGQVWHEEGIVAVAPSAVPHTRSYTLPRSASLRDIRLLIDGFGRAAKRVLAGGLAGVELKCDQGKLHHQFLSLRYNVRDDAYGGSLVNRVRFVRETLQEIREAMPSCVIGVRLPAGTEVASFHGGHDLTPDEIRDIIVLLAEEELVDYVSLSVQTNSTAWGYWQGHPDEYVGTPEPASLIVSACQMAGLPVVLAGYVTTLEQADLLVKDGRCDLVGLTRAHVADPAVVRKSVEGRFSDIMPCIGCNQGCVGNTWYGRPIRCSVNARTGRESVTTVKLRSKTSVQPIVVVGGGPAGLEATRVAGASGANVVLFEQGASLGGQWKLAQALPGRKRFADWLSFVFGQISGMTNIEVSVGTEADVSTIIATDPAGVILATGGSARLPHPIAGFSNVCTAEQAIASTRLWQGLSVLVVDGERHKDALGVAELLSLRGATVHIVTPFDAVGLGMDPVTLTSRLSRLYREQTRMTLWSEVVGVEDRGVMVFNQITNEVTRIDGVDFVVFTLNAIPDVERTLALRDSLTALNIPVRIVGDAVAPRGLEVAIREGFDAGNDLMEGC